LDIAFIASGAALRGSSRACMLVILSLEVLLRILRCSEIW
jgi:hypothetical protein